VSQLPEPPRGRHAAPDEDGFTLTHEAMEAEIDHDRRSERRLVWYTLIALAAVAVLVVVRLLVL
jgi:hypothetical protein